jgi:cytochrome b
MARRMSDARGIVWDLPTRLFHWALAVLVVLQYASGEFGLLPMAWHMRLGYATLALVLFRIAWGFVGAPTSRFATFVRGPRAVLAHVRAFVRGDVPARAGHNPLGGWSVLAMLASVAVQAVTGLFTSDDISEEGPLVARAAQATVDLMTRLHHLNRYLLLGLIVLHLAAIAAYALRGRRLLGAMIHGRDAALADAPMAPARGVRALVVFALACACVWALVAWGDAG